MHIIIGTTLTGYHNTIPDHIIIHSYTYHLHFTDSIIIPSCQVILKYGKIYIYIYIYSDFSDKEYHCAVASTLLY